MTLCLANCRHEQRDEVIAQDRELWLSSLDGQFQIILH